MGYPHGLFAWADLSTPDPQAAKLFYTELFGWAAEDQNDPEGNYVYTMFSQDDRAVAGLGPQSPNMAELGMPAVWNSYVTVANINATVDRWSLAGGTVIMPPMDVFDSGRMAVVADPEGAMIALWQAEKHIGAGVFNLPGALTWNELNSRDVDAARDFYGKALGWEFEEFGDSGYWLITVAGKGEEAHLATDPYNGGILAVGNDFPAEFPAYWGIYFTSENVDRDAAQVAALGGSVVAGPMDTPAGRIVVAADTAGAIFNLIQPPAQV